MAVAGELARKSRSAITERPLFATQTKSTFTPLRSSLLRVGRGRACLLAADELVGERAERRPERAAPTR